MVQVIKQNVIARKISLVEGSFSTPLIQNNDLVCAEGVYLKQFQNISASFEQEKTLLAAVFAGQGECVIKTPTEERLIPLLAGDLLLARNVVSYTLSNPASQEFIASFCWPTEV
jgi:hypothetical protein